MLSNEKCIKINIKNGYKYKKGNNNVFRRIIMFKNNIRYIINRSYIINFIVDNIINYMINSFSVRSGVLLNELF